LLLLCKHKEVVEDVPRLARGGEALDLDKTLLCKRTSNARPYSSTSSTILGGDAKLVPFMAATSPIGEGLKIY